MWKTVKYSLKGKPLIDVNEQGVFYSYQRKHLIKGRLNREKHPYVLIGNFYAHIEVAKAFPEICGEWFEGAEVHHKDGNTLNNAASNLIVCSKADHWKYHHEMRESEMRKAEKEKEREEFKNVDGVTVHYYCRDVKKNKNGLAPIEIKYYKDYKQCMESTGILCKPEDFKNGIYPQEFVENYLNK